MGEYNYMALQRFVETISVDKRAAIAVNSLPENIKESYSEVQSKSLKESVNTNALIKEVLSLRESAFSEAEKQVLSKVVNKLKENGITNGPKLYKFPVARINDADHPNLNGRVYTRELWDNVINKQQDNWKGLCGLSDHPEGDDPGQFKQSSIVWLDMMIDDLNKIVWAIGSFVGQYGHLAQEIIEAGGRIGFSSSGFGELMMDGKTVNPDTYQIERVADIVLNPSQGVYGDVTDEQHPNIEYTSQKAVVTEAIKEIPNNKLSENIATEISAPKAKEPLSAILKEKGNTNTEANSVVSETHGENKEMAENVENKRALVLSEAEEKKLKKYIKQFLAESSEIHNPIDRLKELDEIMEMVESGEIHDLKEDVEKELVAERARLEEMVKDAQSIQDEFGVSAKVFAENAKKVAQVADTLEEENNNLKENAQKAQKESTLLTEQTHDFETLCAALTERVQTLFAENKELKKENNILTVENAALKDKASKVTGLMKEATDLKADNQKLKLKADLRNRKSAALQESVNEKTAAVKQENVKLAAELNNLKETNSSLESSNKKFEKKYAILVSRYKELVNKFNIVEADKKKFEEACQKTQAALDESVTEYNKLKETAVKVAKVAKSTKAENEKVKDQVKGLLSDSPLDYGFYEGVDHNRMKGFVNFRENHGVQIEDYWADLVQKYGEAIMPFENRIRGAKTLEEAHSQFLFNMSKIDENAAKAADMLMDPAVPQSFRETVNASNGYVEETEAVSEEDADAKFRNSLPKGWI